MDLPIPYYIDHKQHYMYMVNKMNIAWAKLHYRLTFNHLVVQSLVVFGGMLSGST